MHKAPPQALSRIQTQRCPIATRRIRIHASAEIAFCPESRDLCAVFFLGESHSPAPSLQPMRASEALVELVKHSFLIDTEERQLLSTHFDALSKFAALPIYRRLDYPRRYDDLPAVRKAVLDCIFQECPTTP